uniref:Uncharacterized protein n=1 Tax=Caenorhabditis japonica TaxID=281687 RepID=A0A8R1IN37_CAEJA
MSGASLFLLLITLTAFFDAYSSFFDAAKFFEKKTIKVTTVVRDFIEVSFETFQFQSDKFRNTRNYANINPLKTALGTKETMITSGEVSELRAVIKAKGGRFENYS